MKPVEAEKLLGGYATGTLTIEERQKLFAAALGHQAIFDALMDEEILRELLADPAVKAQLIAALASAAVPKVVPFWRHPGLLSAAAGLMVAATAGLVYLRSPEKTPPPLQQESVKAPEAKTIEAQPLATQPATSEKKKGPTALLKEATPPLPAAEAAPPPPAPTQALPAHSAASAPAPAAEDAYRARVQQTELARAEAQDKVAKKAEGRRTSAAMMEAVPPPRVDSQQGRADAQNASQGAAPGGMVSGAVGGVASRAPGTAQDESLRDAGPRPRAAAPKAKTGAHASGWGAKAEVTPKWAVTAKSDGSTQVEVTAPGEAVVILLLRGPSGVVALRPQAKEEFNSSFILRRWLIRLVTGDVLDLYLLNSPVADPTQLPETGPVDGFRARIHPASKN